MDYIIVYKAANYYEAHFIKGLLSKYSIESRLLGENLSIGIGELPIEVLQVKILVHKSRFDESKKIIFEYEQNLSKKDPEIDWKCSDCKSMNPSSFELCWNCNK